MAKEKKRKSNAGRKPKKEIPKLEVYIDEGAEHAEDKVKFCYYLQRGATRKDAATLIGLDYSTVFRWMQKDANFAMWVKASLVFFKQQMVEKLAYGYQSNPLEVLRNRHPEEWNAAKKIAIVDPQKEMERMNKIIMGEATAEEVKEATQNADDSELSGVPETDSSESEA